MSAIKARSGKTAKPPVGSASTPNLTTPDVPKSKNATNSPGPHVLLLGVAAVVTLVASGAGGVGSVSGGAFAAGLEVGKDSDGGEEEEKFLHAETLTECSGSGKAFSPGDGPGLGKVGLGRPEDLEDATPLVVSEVAVVFGGLIR